MFEEETARLIAAVEASRFGRQAKRVTCERTCVLTTPCQHRHLAVEWLPGTGTGLPLDAPEETYLGPHPWHAPCIAALEAHLGLKQTRHMVAASFKPF